MAAFLICKESSVIGQGVDKGTLRECAYTEGAAGVFVLFCNSVAFGEHASVIDQHVAFAQKAKPN